MKPSLFMAVALISAGLEGGCDNMQHQENIRTMGVARQFPDGVAEQRSPAHTVSQDASDTETLPIQIRRETLERGRDLFEADCAPCHGADGYGHGIVVRRGYPATPSLHDPKSRTQTDWQIFAVMTSGAGIMYPMADRISANDRWAIVAYVRALQLSQNATVADVPPNKLKELSP